MNEIEKVIAKYKEYIEENEDNASSNEVERWKLVVKALEKQLAKKPNKTKSINGKIKIEIYGCPSCNSEVSRRSIGSWLYQTPYCEDCGQKLDWSEEQHESI